MVGWQNKVKWNFFLPLLGGAALAFLLMVSSFLPLYLSFFYFFLWFFLNLLQGDSAVQPRHSRHTKEQHTRRGDDGNIRR